jgi:hypothetical protein
VADKPGDVRECALAGPRARAGKAELTRQAHDTEREKGDARGQQLDIGEPGP